MRSNVYNLQNQAIHEARAQLEKLGVMVPGDSLNHVRAMAGELNGNVQSISSLSLDQRRDLINRLNALGARVRNPAIYASDYAAERGASPRKEPKKVIVYAEASESQLKMLDALAARVVWKEPDGYVRFTIQQIKCTRPMNNRHVTKLRCALLSILKQQTERASAPVENLQTPV